jgi:putative polyketide hydroxylase
MWKLAHCVHGTARWPLLETYNTERRPVAQQITTQSLQNSINVGRIFAAAVAGGDGAMSTEEVLVASRRYGNHLGVEFGTYYDSPAVVGDGTTPPVVDDSYTDYVQSATPGCRAPHVWLGRADADLSTHDLIGSGFTLLAGPAGAAWAASAADTSRDLGVQIDTYTIGRAGLRDIGNFTTAYGIGDDGAVLVRPDGHIGWRSPHAPVGGTDLTSVLCQILAR